HGRFITRYLQDTGIDTQHVIVDRSGSVTGLTFTEIKSPTDCSILMYRDNVADLKLEPGDVSEDYIQSARALLISGTALAKSPSREAAFKAMELAIRHGVVIVFDIEDDEGTAKQWFKHRAKLVVVKRGGDGSTAFSADGEKHVGAVFPAQVVKTFGAGDSFAGAFIFGLMQGWSIDRCQQFGSASASIVVSSHSCSDAMPTASQIQERIDRFVQQGI
ncbi:PfkB family carbohydrate kinase, partial [Paenibacillus sp. AR247]|uniref:PfkB family carbohydrate kinase n=1 Tax=Paenibacillus sp. AR247 TaxID=1631599 RepID=UPI000CF91D0E